MYAFYQSLLKIIKCSLQLYTYNFYLDGSKLSSLVMYITSEGLYPTQLYLLRGYTHYTLASFIYYVAISYLHLKVHQICSKHQILIVQLPNSLYLLRGCAPSPPASVIHYWAQHPFLKNPRSASGILGSAFMHLHTQ